MLHVELREHQFSERPLDCRENVCGDVSGYYGDGNLSYCNSDASSDYYGDLQKQRKNVRQVECVKLAYSLESAS